MIHNGRVLFNVAQVGENGYEIIHQLKPDFLDLSENDRFHANGDVDIDLIAKNVGTSILVQGSINTVIFCECARCLEKYEYSVAINDYCEYFDNFDDHIDLTDTIREDILLAFPTRPLCKLDCLGICSTCGTNLNISECDCQPEIEELDESSEEASTIWSCFDNIDLDSLGS